MWGECNDRLKVPSAYYQFIIDYAPYLYVIPGSGPDLTWGKATLAAAFAIDFLYEAYSDSQFATKQTEIYNKIVELADFILTQQNTDPAKEACGGFKSTETSTSYYAVDASRAIPALIKAYKLTGTTGYLDAAKLAGATFLYNMQHPPIPTVHDKYYGGFARAVDINDNWLPEMDIENLYGLIGLAMLVEEDPASKSTYEVMMSDLVDFLRSGFEELWLEYRPPPGGDGQWHRVGLNENEIYDDPFAYALIGLYDYEGWSLTVQKVYNFINTIRASAIPLGLIRRMKAFLPISGLLLDTNRTRSDFMAFSKIWILNQNLRSIPNILLLLSAYDMSIFGYCSLLSLVKNTVPYRCSHGIVFLVNARKSLNF
jgi:hypothetical protein